MRTLLKKEERLTWCQECSSVLIFKENEVKWIDKEVWESAYYNSLTSEIWKVPVLTCKECKKETEIQELKMVSGSYEAKPISRYLENISRKVKRK